MTSSGSTLLFGAIPAKLKPSAAEKRTLAQFADELAARLCQGRSFVCLLADDAHLRRLNAAFLRHDYATDVLSFPALERSEQLGDIAISLERAKAQAAEYGHRVWDEVRILMLHGVLHLNGFDHKTGNAMAREEKRWREEFKLPETLIGRAKSREGAA